MFVVPYDCVAQLSHVLCVMAHSGYFPSIDCKLLEVTPAIEE